MFVDGEVGGGAADERDEADVLDDDRVHARARDRAHQALRLSKLLVEHEDVHRDVAADAALVQERDDVGELLDVETSGSSGMPWYGYAGGVGAVVVIGKVVAGVASKAIAEVEAEFDAKERAKEQAEREDELLVLRPDKNK